MLSMTTLLNLFVTRNNSTLAMTMFLVCALTLSACDRSPGSKTDKSEVRVTGIDKLKASHKKPEAVIIKRNSQSEKSESTKPAPQVKNDDTLLTRSVALISGKVTYDDGSPATTGTVESKTYISDSGSSFKMENSGPEPIQSDGSYQIEVVAARFTALEFNGDFAPAYSSVKTKEPGVKPAREKINNDVEVVRGIEVTGRVIDDKDQPVSSATVMFMAIMKETESRSTEITTSTADGGFLFKHIPNGDVTFVASHPDKMNTKLACEVPTTAPLVIVMSSGGGTINGRVLRKETDAPVGGVKVGGGVADMFLGDSTVSKADGSFQIKHLPSGTVSLNVIPSDEKLGFYPSEKGLGMGSVKISDGETTDVTLYVYGGHTFYGKVTDAETGDPLAGAEISNSRRGGNKTAVKSDANGDYRLEHVMAQSFQGNAQISAMLDGYDLVTKDEFGRSSNRQIAIQFSLEPLEVEHDFQMVKTVSISGQVKTADGVPVPGAQVSIMTSGSDQKDKTAVTDSEGKYKLETRPFLACVVKAEARGFALGYSDVVSVVNTDVDGNDVILEVGATISGTVVNPDDQPVPGSKVSAAHIVQIGSTGHYDTQGETVTGKEGQFILPHLPKTVKLNAKSDDYVTSDYVDLNLESGEVKSGVILKLKKSYSIAGTVIDSERNPIESINVNCNNLSGGYANSKTDKDGKFELKNIGEGLYTVSAASQEGSIRKNNVSAGTTDLVLQLEPSDRSRPENDKVTLIGTVVDVTTKEPIEKFTIGNLGASVKMDPDKKGVFRAEVDSRYSPEAKISSPGYLDSSVTLQIPKGKKTFEQTFELGKGGAITGTVVEAGSRKPLNGVVLVNWGVEDNRYGGDNGMPLSNYTTSPDGKFTLAPAAEGKNVIDIRPQSPFSTLERTAQVKNDEIVELGEIEVGKTGVIYGTVTRGSNDTPMSGIAVSVIGHQGAVGSSRKSATTGTDGTYRIEDLPAMSYSIQMAESSVSGYAKLGYGEEKKVDLHLGGVKVFGIITRGGNPAGASVSARSSNGNASVSSQDGKYELKGLEPGEWTFSLYPFNFGGSSVSTNLEKKVQVPDTEEFEQNFQFPDVRISCLVVDGSGNPVPKAAVSISRKSNSGSHEGNRTDVSDGSGRHVFEGIEEGTYDIMARKEDMGAGRQVNISVRDGAPVEVRIELKNENLGSLVSVALNLADGSPIQDAWCSLYGLEGQGSISGSKSNRGADGVLKLTEIPVGKYSFTVGADGFNRASKTIEIKANETVTSEDVLYGVGLLEWNLTRNPDGPGYISVSVEPQDAIVPASSPRVVSYGSGQYKVDNLAPGTYKGIATIDKQVVATEMFTIQSGQTTVRNTIINSNPPATDDASQQTSATK